MIRTLQDLLDNWWEVPFYPEDLCMTQDECIIMSQEEFVAWLESQQG